MATDEYRVERLPSGQRLITEKLDHLRSVCMGFWIPAGSRDEPAPLVGTTHFIEHLLFKGSTKYSAEQIAQTFDALGGELNASTSREYVVVYGRFLDEHPNAVVDFSARLDELGRQPFTAHDFFVRYQDRILFGTDMPCDPAVYRCYFRFLETRDEHFDYPDYIGRFGVYTRWKLCGLDLPAGVLEKVYYRNAERVLPGVSAGG